MADDEVKLWERICLNGLDDDEAEDISFSPAQKIEVEGKSVGNVIEDL